MGQIFEALMIISFGISWPINLYKSIKTKSTKGKSVVFLVVLMAGYIFGIIGKIITKNITWVFGFYILNLVMISADFVVYFVNKKREKTLKTL